MFQGLVADGWADVGRDRVIANMVSPGELRQSSGGPLLIDLLSFAPRLPELGVQINTPAFPAPTFVLRGSLKASVTLFQNGRVIVTAHTNYFVLVAAVEYVRRVLAHLGFCSLSFDPADFQSKNIVGSCLIPAPISLAYLTEHTSAARQNVQFSGVIVQYYRDDGDDEEAGPRRHTLLAFNKRKIVVVGVRSEREFAEMVAVTRPSLYQASPAWAARRGR